MNYREFNAQNEENPLVEKFSQEASEQLFGYVTNNESWQPYYEKSMELSPQDAYNELIPLEDRDITIEDDDTLMEAIDEVLLNGRDVCDKLHNGNYLLIRK